jgi:hypothetical protein
MRQRLFNEIKSTEFRRPDSGFNGAVARDHDHCRAGGLLL